MSHIQKRLDQPMTYQVQVQGRLDASWSDWFDGLAVAVVDDTNGAPVTTLTGLVKDQAALHGLLARIRDLGLPLLLVQRVMITSKSSIPHRTFYEKGEQACQSRSRISLKSWCS
jgi:hypothetical protein